MYHKYPKHKVVRVPEFRELAYGPERWKLLWELREMAAGIMRDLIQCGYLPIVHGSVARGDVDQGSDVDIVLPYVTSPTLVEACLERGGRKTFRKLIVKATPKSALKVLYELDPNGKLTVSFPLEKPSPRELEFYKFGGELSYEELAKGIRVPGVNKSLVLIVPTERGHKESPVIGYEHYVAKLLGINIATVMERVEVLSRRDEIGRTGLFFKQAVDPSMSVEEVVREVLKKLSQ